MYSINYLLRIDYNWIEKEDEEIFNNNITNRKVSLY